MTLLRWWRTRRQKRQEHIRLIRKDNAEAEAIRRFEHDGATRAVEGEG